MTRFLLLLVLLGAVPAIADTPRATPTRTRTRTPAAAAATGTITATPPSTPTRTPTLTGSIPAPARIKPEVIEWPTAAATPPATSCVLMMSADGLTLICIPTGTGLIGGTQRQCVSTGSVAAASTAVVCVTWATAYGSAGAYTTIGAVQESTGTLATLTLHHLSSQTADQACAVVFNQDAAAARTGTVCLEAFPS